MDHSQLRNLAQEWTKRLACSKALELDPYIVSFEKPRKSLAPHACGKAFELDPSIVSFGKPQKAFVSYANQKAFELDPSIVSFESPRKAFVPCAYRKALELDPSIVSFERPQELSISYANEKALELDPSILSFEKPQVLTAENTSVSYTSDWYVMAEESSAQKQTGRPTRPTLAVNGLVQAPPDFSPSSSTTSPSRADATKNMFKTMRPLPLRHIWQFWSDKHAPNTGDKSNAYEERLKPLETVSTIKVFWEILNNVDPSRMYLRDSYHFFKKGVKPIWEDPRNITGGCWTFRVNKSISEAFWLEVLVLVVGEQLQEVVEKGDDICGVTISARFNSHLIMIWNRDGSNQASTNKVLERVLEMLTPRLKPLPQNYYYKKHSDHQGFGNATTTTTTETSEATATAATEGK
ncbi:hypothetical protein FGG08_000272 [Glutinoglossum americanum]|uniref:Translation initiation factor eIF4e n=1 Tax=Glutinoglossum americanum TaxID=1670608 RepID=A0A9P8L1G4_9PEZI|nr:hypothetical protein FGG08_000272 [Glutinoglossum americanum]